MLPLEARPDSTGESGYFLAMLALTDLCMGLSTVHTVLGILWGLSQEIGLDACIAQTFFVHGLSCMESGVLLAMAFDRFTAICNPLRYTCTLTSINNHN